VPQRILEDEAEQIHEKSGGRSRVGRRSLPQAALRARRVKAGAMRVENAFKRYFVDLRHGTC